MESNITKWSDKTLIYLDHHISRKVEIYIMTSTVAATMLMLQPL